jgi:hypothetical protein
MREIKTSDAPGESREDVFSDAGSTPAASTIILGQKRCHAVKAAWHQHFPGVTPPIFYTSKSGMNSAFCDIP